MSFIFRYVPAVLATTDVKSVISILEIPVPDEIHMEDRNHGLAWTNRAKLWRSKFSFLDQYESCLTCQSFAWSWLSLKWVPVKCRWNLSLTTGSVDQSKNALKGSALNHIHTGLLAVVTTTHTPLSLQLATLTFWNYVFQTKTSYLVMINNLARWQTVHHQSVPKTLCEIWQRNTTQ